MSKNALSAQEQIEFARMLAGEFKNPEPDSSRRTNTKKKSKKKTSAPAPLAHPALAPTSAPRRSTHFSPPLPNRAPRYDSSGQYVCSTRPPPQKIREAWGNPHQYDGAALDFMKTSSPASASSIKSENPPKQEDVPVLATPGMALFASNSDGNCSPKQHKNSSVASFNLAAPAPASNDKVPTPVFNNGRDPSPTSFNTAELTNATPQPPPPLEQKIHHEDPNEMELFQQDLFQVIIQSNPAFKDVIMSRDDNELRQSWKDVDFMNEEEAEAEDEDGNENKNNTNDMLPRIDNMTLLDFAAQVFPEIKALSPKKRSECKCREEKRRFFGLENSKYNDQRGSAQPKDLREKALENAIAAIREGVKEGTKFSAQRLASQLLSFEHNSECPYTQIIALQYPLFFGASPAVTENADGGEDLIVIPSHLRQFDSKKSKHDNPLREISRSPSNHHRQDSSLLNTRGVKGGLKTSRWA